MKTKSLLFILLLLIFQNAIAQQRGFKNINIKIEGQTTSLYQQSHALVIGVSDYTNGWPDLPGVKNDITKVKQVLEKNGFHVVSIENPNDKELEDAYEDFIDNYGANDNNRLLFYFAGHGHTMKATDGRDMGYIVPSNAPLPQKDKTGFHRKALSMRSMDKYARDILSKHALFLFDACFSGQLFNLSRAVPASISNKTTKAVRQFITSGSAEEEVPDKSLFREYFVKAITTNDADGNNDNYLTASELSEYLFDNVTNYSYDNQHPQYGKIRDKFLDQGDFVFILGENQVSEPERKISIIEETIATYGSIKLTTEISGNLYFDGSYLKQVRANTLITLDDISTGTHLLKISGENDWEKSVTVYKNYATSLTAEAPKNRKYYEGMVLVKGGTFKMGSNDGESDEKPVHTVTVDDFYIGKYEVTQKQWKEIMGSNPSRYKGDNLPVENVSWDDVQKFIKKLNQKTGQNYRLPTEAEWEYAARGGSTGSPTKYAGSNNIDDVAWYSSNSGRKTHAVGTKKANELGIYDMSGNVWEWCSDWYGSYSSGSQNNPQGSSSGTFRVLRGGSWLRGTNFCRVANRIRYNRVLTGSSVGFRIVHQYKM